MIGPKLGEGREAEIYVWGDHAVLKLYRPGFGGHEAETIALQALTGQAIAPRLIEVIEHDGRTGVVLERLGGTDMLTLLPRYPLRVLESGRTLAAAHLAVHSHTAPDDLPELRGVLAGRIDDASLPTPLRDYAQRLLDGLPDGDRLCHGDYHPGNLLTSPGTASVIDWAAATRGIPEADHTRTLLLLRWANPLPGTPLPFRGLIATGRTLLARAYARAYRNGTPHPLQHSESWLAVNIAARLSEGIDAERPKLTRLLRQAHDHAA